MPEQLSALVTDEVRRLLDERGVSGNALAKATGIPQRSIANKLAGRSAFDLDDLAAICRTLDVPVAELITWAERRS